MTGTSHLLLALGSMRVVQLVTSCLQPFFVSFFQAGIFLEPLPEILMTKFELLCCLASGLNDSNKFTII